MIGPVGASTSAADMRLPTILGACAAVIAPARSPDACDLCALTSAAVETERELPVALRRIDVSLPLEPRRAAAIAAPFGTNPPSRLGAGGEPEQASVADPASARPPRPSRLGIGLGLIL